MRAENIRLYLLYLGIIFTIIGLPFSRAMISFGQVTMGVVFLFDKNLIAKLKSFIHNKAALAFVSFYILLWLGIIHSNDLHYAFFDLRTKLPLLIFPLVFATEKPLENKVFRFFLLIFVATIITSISTSLWIYFTMNLADYRDAFPFISHIRIGLGILISISILFYYLFNENDDIPKWIKVIFIIALVYLIWATIILELMTGIVILIITSVFYLIHFAIKNKSHIWTRSIIGGSFFLLFLASLWVYNVSHNYITVADCDLNNLDEFSELGHKYEHKPYSYQIENGSYIGIYTQWDEMRQEWNKVSNLDYDGEDNKNQLLRYTLQRYLNSKHLRKDAHGVKQLTKQDIASVENGVANVEYTKKFSFKKRIYKLLWEYGMYKRGETAFGHTLIQRIELWKTAWQIFEENPIFGVGTGDIPSAFKQKFIENNSPLLGSKLRSHNEYLSTMASLGIVGLIVFLFSIFYPPTYLKVWNFPLLFLLLSFICISMLWEDTIETQVGVTIFAFFYAFYVFARNKESDNILDDKSIK